LNGALLTLTVEKATALQPIFVPHSPVLTSIAIPRKLCVALVLLLTLALSRESSAQVDQHLRALDQPLRALLERGSAQSPTLRGLLAEVEATPLLVFVECAIRLPSGVGGRMNFVTSVDGMRFVRIAVDCALTERWQIILLAHEIQHALEIGRRPDVDDVEAMELLYEEIGFPTVRDGQTRHFETEEAMVVQRAVDRELDGRSERALATY
jgi:hypothetical protein